MAIVGQIGWKSAPVSTNWIEQILLAISSQAALPLCVLPSSISPTGVPHRNTHGSSLQRKSNFQGYPHPTECTRLDILACVRLWEKCGRGFRKERLAIRPLIDLLRPVSTPPTPPQAAPFALQGWRAWLIDKTIINWQHIGNPAAKAGPP